MEQVGKAMGRVPSGLYIMTAHHENRDDAVLVSWVNQCSFDAPTLSVVLSKTRAARLLVEASNAFILNVLGKEDFDLLKRFSKPPASAEALFEGLETRVGHGGCAVLSQAVSYLECELIAQTPVEDHVVYFGKVVGGDMLKGGDPYVHIRNSGFSY